MLESGLRSARAEALFASTLQRSDDPTPTQIRAAISTTIRNDGLKACAASVAQEYGEHPIEAVARMSWVLAELRMAYPETVWCPPVSLPAYRTQDLALKASTPYPAPRPSALDDEMNRLVDIGEVRAALKTLADRLRDVLIEIYVLDRSVADAAETLAVPANIVRTRTFHALEAVRAALLERGFTLPGD